MIDKKMRYCAILCLYLIFATGCSSEAVWEEPDTATPDKIHSMITDFYRNVHRGSRSADSGFRISNIETHNYKVEGHSETRADRDNGTKSYDIHTVTLDFGETSGYAILSDTPGIDRIFYYTEEGAIGDTAVIEPLRYMVETCPTMAEMILNGDIPESGSQTRADINIDPLVRFRWHQEWPYNFCATYCTCSKCSTDNRKNHRLAGCTSVALAQTIATVKIFRGTFYGNRDIDFDALPSYVSKYEKIAPDIEMQLGHFLQEIALNCQTKYGCDGTGSDIYSAANYMRDIGYLSDVCSGELDVDRYIMYLQIGIPHIMRGVDESGDGHTWILDGIKMTGTSCMYHVNWGYGFPLSNGWSDKCYFSHFEHYGDIYHMDYPKKHMHMYIGRAHK